MNLKKLAEADIKRITSNTANGFADAATFVAPDTTEYSVNVIHTKHHLGVDPEYGTPINTKVASVAFSESNLSATIRNADDQVNLDGWKIKVQDSTETEVTYYVKEWFPDEMIGMIVVILTY